jgi:lactate racemase
MLYSSLSHEQVRAAHLIPCEDINATLQKMIAARPEGMRIGVLPQGPLTILYLS